MSNHTIDIAVPLTVECARRGLKLELHTGGYDQYRQELLESGGAVDKFKPDAILISLHLETAFPDLSAATCAASQALPDADRWILQFHSLLESYRRRNPIPIFVQNFIPPALEMDGLLSSSGMPTVFEWVMELNRSLRDGIAKMPSVFLVDAAQLACRSGLAGWRDQRLWHLAKAGIHPKQFPALAKLVARCFSALRRPAAKCVVVDLDNTVWGGILGETGFERIHCVDGDYPGNAYASFQRALLALRSRGVLLAVASKNDWPAVEQAFRERRDMVLRPEHISEWQVHWEPKPESIKRIAERLNIGLDSMVFLDDNPAEVALVRMSLPQVRAYQMPDKPEQFLDFLAALEDFDQLSLSAEDLRRAEFYEVRRKQDELAQTATDLESFYRSLQTVVTPEEAGASNFDRIVQLFQKTNQFNLTTQRYQKPDLLDALARRSELWAFRARDVHADQGIVAVALLHFKENFCEMDSFLMSCRIIGRTVETALLHFLEQRAMERGASYLLADHVPTPKNGPCREFLEQHGYQCIYRDDQRSRWQKQLGASATACPPWITLNRELSIACSRN